MAAKVVDAEYSPAPLWQAPLRQQRAAHDTLIWGHPQAEESPVGKVVMYSSVSVDGFVADENDHLAHGALLCLGVPPPN